ncbi:hypothetical protein TWF481_005235 [Arthrobotrys musiformis]|uniref:Uncharacterized protein n=1 Tax=Arthrobotrys musiformis TaxID=47236 RepID=A0AAV9WD33_9PEZI
MKIWFFLHSIAAIGLAAEANGTMIRSKRSSATSSQSLGSRDVGRQEYLRYPEVEFRPGVPGSPDGGTNLWFKAIRAVKTARATFESYDNFYCTTLWKHDGKTTDYSQASLFCKDKISIEIFNKREESLSSPKYNVKILCKDAVEIAAETLDNISNGDAGKADGRRRDKRQRWFTSSNWSEDPSWGVAIVELNDGCPSRNDTIQNVVLSNTSEDVVYTEPNNRRTLADLGGFETPSG